MPSVRVLHVIPSISPTTGGPAQALGGYVNAARSAGIDCVVLTTDAAGKDQPAWASSVDVRVSKALPGLPMNLSPGMLKELVARARGFDCIHLHGNWQFHSLASALTCRLVGKPLVLRPCGGLSAIEWTGSPASKKLYLRLIERHVVESVRVMHYTTEEERTESARLVGERVSVVIPPPVDAPRISSTRDKLRSAHDVAPGELIVLFVGRLHPIKRCDLLIRAMPLLPDHVRLVLVGSDWGDQARLLERARSLGLSGRVRFEGAAHRKQLDEWLGAADLFALASAHENFGLAAAEACAAGLPCVLPRDLPVARDLGAACVAVDDTPEGFAGGMRRLLDPSVRVAVGLAARAHATTHWSSQAIGARLCALYELACERRRGRSSGRAPRECFPSAER